MSSMLIATLTVAALSSHGGPVGMTAAARLVVEARLLPISAPAVGYGLLAGGRARWDHDLLTVSGIHGGLIPRHGFVTGSVYLTDMRHDELSARLLAHERRHVAQWTALGLTLPFLYAAADRAGPVLGLGTGPGGNVFEIAAGLEDGGYEPCTPLRRGHPALRRNPVCRLDPSTGSSSGTRAGARTVRTGPSAALATPAREQARRSTPTPAPPPRRTEPSSSSRSAPSRPGTSVRFPPR